MDPGTIALTVAGWFAQPAVEALLSRSGISSPSPAADRVEPYFQKLRARHDEDRIAKLYGAFTLLVEASRLGSSQHLLDLALKDFHEIAQIPQQGITGNQRNAELRCMAYLGMAAYHTLLQYQPELIVEKMTEAVSADSATAEQWLGRDVVREICSRLPTVACPQCGFQNPAGSQFCNRDGSPLQTSTLSLIRKPSIIPDVVDLSTAIFGEKAGLKIILDGSSIGFILKGESSTFEIQPGRHTLFLRQGGFSSPHRIFDIAPHEKVTFFCQTEFLIYWYSIRLWKL